MKRILSLTAVSLLAAAALCFNAAAAFGQSKLITSPDGIKGRYIVILNEKYIEAFASAPAIGSEAMYLSMVHGGKIERLFSSAFKGFVIETTEKGAESLSNDERVLLVEQDIPIYAEAIQSSATWGLDRIDQRALPMNASYGYLTDASNVHAYVIDSGVRTTHVEFGGRATKDVDLLTDGQNGNDCMGHGTHVAGTIGGATYGVAKNIRIHSVRVLPCTGTGQISDLLAGVDWVTANHQSPAVANISITASGPSSILDTAIQNSINSGVTYVVAAGNYNQDACIFSPARAANAITVGATYTADDKAAYSDYGSCVDIWAPGTLITSASFANDTDSRLMSGTSMASPHVAGVAALYLAAHPNAAPAAVTQAVISTSTAGVVTGLDSSSPNRLVYSLLGQAPPVPVAGRVTIVKRANRQGETITNAEFPFEAVNLSASNFTLQPDNQFDDANVVAFGSANTIVVTEDQVLGWVLRSIDCTESSGQANTTVDLANRQARIVVEEGESVQCTFTSDQLVPSAANATAQGRVVDQRGRGIRGIRLSILDANTGLTRFATSNTFGYYRFTELPVDHFYIVSTLFVKRYEFANAQFAFTLMDDRTGIDFVGVER